MNIIDNQYVNFPVIVKKRLYKNLESLLLLSIPLLMVSLIIGLEFNMNGFMYLAGLSMITFLAISIANPFLRKYEEVGSITFNVNSIDIETNNNNTKTIKIEELKQIVFYDDGYKGQPYFRTINSFDGSNLIEIKTDDSMNKFTVFISNSMKRTIFHRLLDYYETVIGKEQIIYIGNFFSSIAYELKKLKKKTTANN